MIYVKETIQDNFDFFIYMRVQKDLRRAQKDLRRAQNDLRNAQNDLRNAQKDIRTAQDDRWIFLKDL